ncbi:unnamed protein product [Phytophthora fragariaefolia]|uniref:Unnamed protein product n=1 Tax=Phytophthora fragariaefolia TaxID=1490495 RepID=A0A9W6YBC9_9STRA|nr:unnamed protein product [Phytophthora fragariaefolia]
MVFCMSAYLNFASMIERILGTKFKRTLRLHSAHADALLPASELLQLDNEYEFETGNYSEPADNDDIQADKDIFTP